MSNEANIRSQQCAGQESGTSHSPYRIETRAVHGYNHIDLVHTYGSISTPIFQTATFQHIGVKHSTGYDYTRVSNPTRDELESLVSSLEGAGTTLACATGMAAVDVILSLFDPGDHIIATDDLYGGSVRLFDTAERTRGLSFTYTDTSDCSQVEPLIRPETKALYIETPSNPTMKVTDLRAMKALCEQHHLLLIVDNTFLSPYYQRPIALGADLVIHSGTKYLEGHNDTLAGFVCTAPDREDLAEKLRLIYKTVGCNLAPFDSFMLIRGIKTLAVRMDRIQDNAMKIAAFLKTQPKVLDVLYVGLPEHPGYQVSLSQTTGFGGMISFHVDTKETAYHLLESVKLIKFAESLGGVETLITHHRLQTHADLPGETAQKLGITDNFLGLSVGIENADDLIEDLRQALA